MNNNANAVISIYSGKSKNGKSYEGILITAGKWSKLVFAENDLTLDYIKQHIKEVEDNGFDINN